MFRYPLCPICGYINNTNTYVAIIHVINLLFCCGNLYSTLIDFISITLGFGMLLLFCDKNVFVVGLKPFVCMECDATFSFSRDLMNHRMHHSSEDRPHVCNICNKSYREPSGLRRHVLMHQGIKPHLCSTCGKRFMDVSGLNSHNLSMHTADNRKYECQICNKRFVKLSYLHYHNRRVHLSDKPFRCTVCGKKFINRNELMIHMRTHTGEKPFACTTCGKQFTQMINLKLHQVVHTGAKPHVCKVCGQEFTQSTSRNRHMRNVHGLSEVV